MTSSKFRQFRRTVYELKQKFGTSLQLCRTSNDVADYATGKKAYTLVTTTIKKVVVMPSKDLRHAMHMATDVSRKQDFAFGGFFDTRTKAVMVSQRDVPPDFPIDLNMFVVLGGMRWEVKGLEETESDEYLVLTIQELDGSVPPPIPPPPVFPSAIVAPGQTAFIVYAPTGATLDASGSGKVYTTSGATADASFLLPAWVEGLQYTFHVGAAFDLRVIAHGTDTIQDGGSWSTPGGNVDTQDQNAIIQLTAIAPGIWTVTYSTRNWSAN